MMSQEANRDAESGSFEAIAAALKGRDVILDVVTVKGTRCLGRRLNNVTVTRTSVCGWDPVKGAVRQFKLELVERMVLAADQTSEAA